LNPLILPFLTYAIVSIFTPGPSNISTSTLGARVGFRRTIPYIAGTVLAFFLILMVSALLTNFLQANYARYSLYLRWIGAIYILWLALSLFLPKREKASKEESSDWGFGNGFLVVLLNPKGILFAITIFVSFSALLTGTILKSLIASAFMAFLCACATSLWAIAGAMLFSAFRSKSFSLVFNIIMAFLLLYAAYSIVFH
jgi:cysteine/O-acetylserine efflux protein